MPPLSSLYNKNASQWPAFYALLEQQLGSTATLLNFGNQATAGKVNATTFTGRRFNASGLAPTWTPSEALSAFDTAFDLTDPANWLGLAPILTFNGTDEEADTPDAAYWTRVETAAFSMGAWINPTDVTTVTILSKWDETTSAELREWLFFVDSASKLALNLYDESANIQVKRPSSTSIVANQWQFVVVTYTGDGGADAADSINLYINGAADNGTASNNASYVAMEDLATLPGLGFYKGPSSNTGFFAGGMLGGPWSPFFCQKELTAAEIANIYQTQRLGLGV